LIKTTVLHKMMSFELENQKQYFVSK